LFYKRLTSEAPQILSGTQGKLSPTNLNVNTFSTAGVVVDSKKKEKKEETLNPEEKHPQGQQQNENEGGELELDHGENEDEKTSEESQAYNSIYGPVMAQRPCIMITALGKIYGTFLLTISHMVFQGKRVYEDCSLGIERVHVPYAVTVGIENLDAKEEKKSMSQLGEPCSVQLTVPMSTVRQVMPRLFLLQDSALEIFFKDYLSAFFNFHDEQDDRNFIYKRVCRILQLPYELSPSRRLIHSGIVFQWQRGEISNYQYLMHINTLAGRTFNDVSQYPVFPWVLQDYTSKTLNLDDHKVYRDLTKPMGALNPDRCEVFDERFENPLPDVPPFHYGSHYSSPGVINYFLIRIEPYSTLARSQQGGRFDLADRLFDSIQKAWNLSYTQISDVKELIPEFYSNPAFLRNVNNLSLGQKQNGTLVGDVELPPWAKGKPEEFIRLHRKALESDYVTKNLHHWIDLIFGVKQRGAAAQEAKNLFYYLTYAGQVDVSLIEDSKILEATLAQISSFGQTPLQIFTLNHPTVSPISPKHALILPFEPSPVYTPLPVAKIAPTSLLALNVNINGRLCIIKESDGGSPRRIERIIHMVDLSTILTAVVQSAYNLSGDTKLCSAVTCVSSNSLTMTRSSGTLRESPLKNIKERISIFKRKKSKSNPSISSRESSIKPQPQRFSVAGFLTGILSKKDSQLSEDEKLSVNMSKVTKQIPLNTPRWLLSQPAGVGDYTFKPKESSKVKEEDQLKTIIQENPYDIGPRSTIPGLLHDRQVALSLNSKFMFVGGYTDNCFRCYLREANRSVMLSQVYKHETTVTCLRLARIQTALITGDYQGSVCIWNTALRSHQWRRSPISLEPTSVFRVHDGPVIDCAVAPKVGIAISVGRCSALSGRNGIGVYSTYLRRCLRLIEPPQGLSAIRGEILRSNEDGILCILMYAEPQERIAGAEGVLLLYSQTGDIIARRGMGGYVTSLCLTPMSAFVACGMASGDLVFLKSWDLSIVQAIDPNTLKKPSIDFEEKATERKNSMDTPPAPTQPSPGPPPNIELNNVTESGKDKKHTKESSESDKVVEEEERNVRKDPVRKSLLESFEKPGAVTGIAFPPDEQYCILAHASGVVYMILLPERNMLSGFAAFVTASQQLVGSISSSLLEMLQLEKKRIQDRRMQSREKKTDAQMKVSPANTRLSLPPNQQSTGNRSSVRAGLTGIVRGFGSFFQRNRNNSSDRKSVN